MTRDNRFEDAYSLDMEGWNINMCEVLDRIENRGIEQGIAQEEDNAFSLVKFLIANDRMEDLKKVLEDEAYRNKLMIELAL